ncbi:MAG: hypothetical protein AB1724_06605 [Thermodesulfobacteriota bacterium]
MNFLNRLWKRRQTIRKTERPPRPEGWNLTIADLMAEVEAGRRKTLGPPELDWARDYERSLIPETMRFPAKGDVFEALQDMEVEFMTAWSAPFTGGGKAVIKQGEKVRVDSEPSESRPIGTYAVAVDYKTMEERMVPAADRNASKYGGFYFYFSTIDLNTRFALVPMDPERASASGKEETGG